MAKPAPGVETGLGLEDLDAYHTDSAAALRLYFNPKESGFSERFALQSLAEVSNRFQSRLNELDLRSCLALLTRLEASFQGDFRCRCERKLKDSLSRHFRNVKKRRGTRIRLDEDILEGWRLYSSASARLIGDLIRELIADVFSADLRRAAGMAATAQAARKRTRNGRINQCRALRDTIPPTPPGPEGSNGNGLVWAQ